MNPSRDTTKTDAAALSELGKRLARHRLERNLTQAQLAHEAGVSKRTVSRLESGLSTQLTNLLRVLRALGLLDLDALAPEPADRPIERLRGRGRPRQRASSRRNEPAAPPEWTWGDDEEEKDDE